MTQQGVTYRMRTAKIEPVIRGVGHKPTLYDRAQVEAWLAGAGSRPHVRKSRATLRGVAATLDTTLAEMKQRRAAVQVRLDALHAESEKLSGEIASARAALSKWDEAIEAIEKLEARV